MLPGFRGTQSAQPKANDFWTWTKAKYESMSCLTSAARAPLAKKSSTLSLSTSLHSRAHRFLGGRQCASVLRATDDDQHSQAGIALQCAEAVVRNAATTQKVGIFVLLDSWFSRVHSQDSASIYRLYATTNLWFQTRFKEIGRPCEIKRTCCDQGRLHLVPATYLHEWLHVSKVAVP